MFKDYNKALIKNVYMYAIKGFAHSNDGKL